MILLVGLIGLGSDNMRKIMTKFESEINFDIYSEYLVKSIFKLLPLKEEDKDWEKYLDGLMVEVSGMSELLLEEINLIVLLAKLEGLRTVEEHSLFRKIIFDSIDLIKKIQVG